MFSISSLLYRDEIIIKYFWEVYVLYDPILVRIGFIGVEDK